MKTLIIIALLLIATPCYAEFSVDGRSGLHVGMSALIGAGLDTFVVSIQEPEVREAQKWQRRAFIGAACLMPGLAKETMMDAEFDSGGMFFNVVGCVAGISIVEGLALSVTDHSVAVVGTW